MYLFIYVFSYSMSASFINCRKLKGKLRKRGRKNVLLNCQINSRSTICQRLMTKFFHLAHDSGVSALHVTLPGYFHTIVIVIRVGVNLWYGIKGLPRPAGFDHECR